MQASTSDLTRPILDWLMTQPSDDIDEEIRLLGNQLDALYSPTIPSGQFERCIELFHQRAMRTASDYRRSMRTHELPLTEPQLFSARALADSLKRIALGFERVLLDTAGSRLRGMATRRNETLSAHALRLLGEQFLVLGQAGIDPEPQYWKLAYRLYLLSCGEDGAAPTNNPAETAVAAFKHLLALISLEPQGLSSAELGWAAAYVAPLSTTIHLQDVRPASLEGAWYWIDPYSTFEPQACVRATAPEDRPILYFSTAGLARRASDLISRHEDGQVTSSDLLPSETFPGVSVYALLSRLRQRWHTPSGRIHPRRQQDYKVEACIGLKAIWQTLRSAILGKPSTESVSEWLVTNESPGGFAIMQVQGRSKGLMPGTVVALRRDPAEQWSICVVRWLRSDAADQIEIGLQMVSKDAIPVRVAFRDAKTEGALREALVLPVLPALRQHQAVLAPAGTYASRRFTLVSDVDRVYIAQCRLLSLDMQTSNLELFQFEIDPYPI